MKTIAILGGAGAYASLACHRNLLDQYVARANPKHDEDYPNITHISRSDLGVNHAGAVGCSYKVKAALAQLKWDFLLVPCNSLQTTVNNFGLSNFIHMPEVVKPQLIGPGVVFCSSTTRAQGTYDGEEIIYHDQQLVDLFIKEGIAGNFRNSKFFDDVLWSYTQKGITPIIACSDLTCFELSTPHIDTVKLTNTHVVDRLMEQAPL